MQARIIRAEEPLIGCATEVEAETAENGPDGYHDALGRGIERRGLTFAQLHLQLGRQHLELHAIGKVLSYLRMILPERLSRRLVRDK